MEAIVNTEQGRVRGAVEKGGVVFLGIPYAAPPVGEGRFAPPQRPERWEGIRDALAYGATALQPQQEFTLIPEPLVPGDNCLNLNVFTPDPGHSGLPVLVWIHGGGFFAGCNASPWYRGERFARDGVVLVSINYRLGARGFPSGRGRWRQPRRPRLAGRPGVGAAKHRGLRRQPLESDGRRAVRRRHGRCAAPVHPSLTRPPAPRHQHEWTGGVGGDGRAGGRDRPRCGRGPRHPAHATRTQRGPD